MQAVVNWFSFVGQQWLSSLKVFLPKNFKLFALVTLNAWWQAFVSLFKNFWWFLIPFLGLESYFYFNEYYQFFLTTLHAFSFVSYYMFFLAIRPSVHIKDLSYYLMYFKHVLFFIAYSIFLMFLFSVLLMPITYGLPFLVNIFSGIRIFYFIALGLMVLFRLFLPNFLIFSFLFFLDGSISMKNGFKSLINGFKMFLYTLPLATIIFFILSYLSEVISYFFSTFYFPFNFLVGKVILAFCLSVLIAAFNIIYIRKAHEDYEVYFG